ncbi:MAG: phosphoadenylyl-sulfate reductase [Pseudomonadota bacterium]
MRPDGNLAPDCSRLNALYAERSAESILADASNGVFGAKAALVSSFGAESAVLLHMLSRVSVETPVLFVDTEMLFAETLEYQLELAERFGLRNVIRVRPEAQETAWEDPIGDLNTYDTDACCNLRKVRPLARALRGYDVSITGRKRHQSSTREDLSLFESENGRIKINPLAAWRREDVLNWMDAHALPRHPLTKRGFPSIGCAPCTTKVRPGEDPRSGRWRGQDKTECGIHFIGGRLVTGRADPKPLQQG